MRFDLRAETQDETAFGVRLHIPADVGDRHRIARERHRDAGAKFDGRGVFGGQHQRQEWVVVDLGGPAAVVAPVLQPISRVGDVRELAGDGPVDLETAVVTHTRGRYSKQFSMVNVSTPVRRSPFHDGNCA